MEHGVRRGVRFAKFYRDPEPCPVNEVLQRVYNSISGDCYHLGEVPKKTAAGDMPIDNQIV